MATSDLAWVIKFPIPRCPKCGKEGVEVIGRLIGRDEMPCAYSCGGTVDLRPDEYRIFLNKCVEALDHIRPAYEKLP